MITSQPDLSLSGRRALVTGGTRGIGAKTARLLTDAGADVVVAARTPPESPQSGTRFVSADLATAGGATALAQRTLELLGGIDILVSNAGGQTHRPDGILAFDDADWERDLSINLMAAVRLDRALVPAMIEAGGGAIVHVGSNAARLPRPASLPYTASKAALSAYSKGLAIEAGAHRIRVNTVLPGLIHTDALAGRVASVAAESGVDGETVLAEMVQRLGIPLGRPGTPEEAARLIAFLVSPAAGYVSGAQIPVDGAVFPTL